MTWSEPATRRASTLRKARQRLQSYLLVRDRHYGFKMWGTRHREWLSRQLFEHPAQQIAYQGYLNADGAGRSRRQQLEEQIAALLPSWSLAPVVTALQALRGVAPVIAVSIVAEVGDVSRFESPRKLMAYLGLIPGEHSSGATIRARGITKQGNSVLRSLLFEAAWAYRFMAKVSVAMKARRPEGIPQSAIDIAWKAQLRLCGRYRKLLAKGKKSQVAITAVARELLGFVWAIATTVSPRRRSVRACIGSNTKPRPHLQQTVASGRAHGPGLRGNPRAATWSHLRGSPTPDRGSPPTHGYRGLTNARMRV